MHDLPNGSDHGHDLVRRMRRGRNKAIACRPLLGAGPDRNERSLVPTMSQYADDVHKHLKEKSPNLSGEEQEK